MITGEPVVLSWLTVGPAAQVMTTTGGAKVWVDAGVPTVVVGAAVGDLYLDSDTGILYQLN